MVVLVVGGLYWIGVLSTLNSGSNDCGPGNVGATCQGIGGPPFGFGTVTQAHPPTMTAGECAATHFCYEFAISEAPDGLIAGDLQLKLSTNAGMVLAIVSWYVDSANVAVDGFLSSTSNPSGGWLSTPGTGGTAMEMSSSTLLTGSMNFWIDVSATVSPYGEGDILTAIGEGPFSDSVTTTLP